MTAARLWLLILGALVLQQLLPAMSADNEGAATRSAVLEDAPAPAAPRGTSPGSR
jgi:hypothetical protein